MNTLCFLMIALLVLQSSRTCGSFLFRTPAVRSIAALKQKVASQGVTIARHNSTIAELRDSVVRSQETVAKQVNTVAELNDFVVRSQEKIASQCVTIATQVSTVAELNDFVVRSQEKIASQCVTIATQVNTVAELNDFVVRSQEKIASQCVTIASTIAELKDSVVRSEENIASQGSTIAALNGTVVNLRSAANDKTTTGAIKELLRGVQDVDRLLNLEPDLKPDLSETLKVIRSLRNNESHFILEGTDDGATIVTKIQLVAKLLDEVDLLERVFKYFEDRKIENVKETFKATRDLIRDRFPSAIPPIQIVQADVAFYDTLQLLGKKSVGDLL
jgi:uncharacterized coiled-coil protein SlyX